MWNPSKKGENIILEENGLGARIDNTDWWVNVVAEIGYSKGKHSWNLEFELNSLPSKWNVYVVCF